MPVFGIRAAGMLSVDSFSKKYDGRAMMMQRKIKDRIKALEKRLEERNETPSPAELIERLTYQDFVELWSDIMQEQCQKPGSAITEDMPKRFYEAMISSRIDPPTPKDMSAEQLFIFRVSAIPEAAKCFNLLEESILQDILETPLAMDGGKRRQVKAGERTRRKVQSKQG